MVHFFSSVMFVLIFLVIVGLDPAIKERDVRLKAEHDVEKRLNMTSCSQLDRNTGCGMNLC